MRIPLPALALLAALVVPAVAHADSLDSFSLTGSGLDLTFTLPSAPTPDGKTTGTDFYIGDVSFMENDVAMTADDVYFYTSSANGGFELQDASGDVIDGLAFFGPQLFKSGVKSPIFKTGPFGLTGGPGCGVGGGTCGAYSLDIEPIAPTPEPSSLALLGTGLLAALGVVRRRFVR